MLRDQEKNPKQEKGIMGMDLYKEINPFHPWYPYFCFDSQTMTGVSGEIREAPRTFKTGAPP